MAKQHNGDAVWVEIDPETLPEAQRKAYEQYKAFYRQAKDARKVFEAGISKSVQEGKRMIFGYNFGKLSVAIVDDDRPAEKPKQAKLSLADYLATMSAGGYQS